MHHKIARIGSWFFAMVVFMCCVSTSVRAVTTSPVWFLTDVREIGIQSEDGFYHRDGTNEVYALIYPKTYEDENNGFISVPSNSLNGEFYKNINNFYSGSFAPTNFSMGNVSFYLINKGWEPYSYYDFTVDSNWRIMIDSSLTTNNYKWFVGDKSQRATVTEDNTFGIEQDITTSGKSQYKAGSESYTALNQNIWINQGAWYQNTGALTNWISPIQSAQSISDTTSHTGTQSIHINDLIISLVPGADSINDGGHDSASGKASFMLFCPVSYIPKGLKLGDIWPIGNILKPHDTPEENAVKQFSGDKESIESVGESLENGINSITDFTTTGIGDSTTTNIDLISSLFNNIFPWWFDIFGLMFLFGVLGIVVRRALHD